MPTRHILKRSIMFSTLLVFVLTISMSIIPTVSAGPAIISNVKAVNSVSAKKYTPIYHGPQKGEKVYVDRDIKFSSVPSFLQGQDVNYIRTINDDKHSSGLSFLTFDVNQDVDVYVAHDDKIKLNTGKRPKWLTDNFADTGFNLVTTDTTLSIFKSKSIVLAGGKVKLGGNVDVDIDDSMYSVIVKMHKGSCTKPDLVVDSIVYTPKNPVAGDEVTIDVTVKNQGCVDTGFFFIGWFLDKGKIIGGDIKLKKLAGVQSLAAGATHTWTFKLTYKIEGCYTMYADVDLGDAVVESNENNNRRIVSNFCIGKKPDIFHGKVFYIECQSTGRVLDVDTTDKPQYANIQQWEYHGGKNQAFEFISVWNVEGYYYIRSKHSNKVLEVDYTNKKDENEDGRNIHQSILTFGRKSQQFKIESAGNGYYYIRTRQSNKSLDVDSLVNANGGNIQEWAFHGGNNQQFKIMNGYYYITAKHSGKVLEVADSSTANRANVQQGTKIRGANQQFILKSAGRDSDGNRLWYIESRHSGKVLDVADWNYWPGNIYQWTKHGGNNQKFRFRWVGGYYGGYYYIYSHHSKQNLEVDKRLESNGNVRQYYFTFGKNQQFTLTHVPLDE